MHTHGAVSFPIDDMNDRECIYLKVNVYLHEKACVDKGLGEIHAKDRVEGFRQLKGCPAEHASIDTHVRRRQPMA